MLKEKMDPKAVEEADEKELSLDECEQVTGGSIRDVQYTKTVDISEDVKERI